MRKLLLAALFAVPLFAHAGATDKLRNFIQQTRSIKADFSQTVYDKGTKVLSESSGTLRMFRPGKFRWEYVRPFSQLIVGDGKKLWLWDPDLNQATVKAQDEALGSSPAALLAGSDTIEQSFTLKEAGKKGGLEWLEALPKSADVSFERIRMGFNAKTLDTMELNDNFGQRTVIRFRNITSNSDFPAETFSFSPPAGADVVGDQ
jgi:outer membrane lipoprotein carrier protein